MSGGKGGSTSASVEVPEFIRAPAERNIQRAEQVQQLGYMPYMGVDVAAPTPGMQNLMQQRGRTAESLGIVGPGYDPMAGMPEAQTIGGVTGYRSFDPAFESVQMLAEASPEQMGRFGALYQGTPTQQVNEMTPNEAASLLNQIAMQAQGGNSDGGNVDSGSYDMGYVPGIAAGFGRTVNQGFPSVFGAIGDAVMSVQGYDYNPVTGDYEQRDYMGGGSAGYTTVSGRDGDRNDNDDRGGYDSYSDAGKAATDRGETFF